MTEREVQGGRAKPVQPGRLGRPVNRLEAIDKDSEPKDVFAQQLAVIMDTCVAQLIRNSRTGQGKGLRETGLIETANELGM